MQQAAHPSGGRVHLQVAAQLLDACVHKQDMSGDVSVRGPWSNEACCKERLNSPSGPIWSSGPYL